MIRWEDFLFWSFVLEYLCQHRNEENFFGRFWCSNDLFYWYGGYCYSSDENYTSKLIYNQLGFFGSGWDGEKIFSSEVLYCIISISAGMKIFYLTFPTALMTYYGATADILMEGMKTTRTNQCIFRFFLLEMDDTVIIYALLKLCIGVSLSAQECINLLW